MDVLLKLLKLLKLLLLLLTLVIVAETVCTADLTGNGAIDRVVDEIDEFEFDADEVEELKDLFVAAVVVAVVNEGALVGARE